MVILLVGLLAVANLVFLVWMFSRGYSSRKVLVIEWAGFFLACQAILAYLLVPGIGKLYHLFPGNQTLQLTIRSFIGLLAVGIPLLVFVLQGKLFRKESDADVSNVKQWILLRIFSGSYLFVFTLWFFILNLLNNFVLFRYPNTYLLYGGLAIFALFLVSQLMILQDIGKQTVQAEALPEAEASEETSDENPS